MYYLSVFLKSNHELGYQGKNVLLCISLYSTIHVLFAKHSVVQIFGRRNINVLNNFEYTSEFSGKNKLLKVLYSEKFDSISAI